MEHTRRKEGRKHDDDSVRALLSDDAVPHIPDNRRDNGADACLHAGKQPGNERIFAKQLIEIRDHRNDNKRRNDGRNRRNSRTGNTGQLIADDNCAVDRNRAWR